MVASRAWFLSNNEQFSGRTLEGAAFGGMDGSARTPRP